MLKRFLLALVYNPGCRKGDFEESCGHANYFFFPFTLSHVKRGSWESFRQADMCSLEFWGPSDSQGRNLKAIACDRQNAERAVLTAYGQSSGPDKGLMEGQLGIILNWIFPKKTTWSDDVTGQGGGLPYDQLEEAMSVPGEL